MTSPIICVKAERPTRIQLSRAKGWRMPPNTVKVDRTTVFGNPWTVRGAIQAGYVGTEQQVAAMCVGLFREFITEQPGSLTALLKDAAFLRARIRGRLPSLRGKNLACWCRLDAPCHADVLLKLANPEGVADPVSCDGEATTGGEADRGATEPHLPPNTGEVGR